MQNGNIGIIGTLGALTLGLAAAPAGAAISKEMVNQAYFKKAVPHGTRVRPLLIKAQVLLKRALVSPGVIDGRYSANTRKALRVYQQRKGLPVTSILDATTWKALASQGKDPVLGTYTITKNDVNGPFLRKVPGDVRQMAKLKRMSYTSPKELLAERFHMSEALLKTLNPGVNFKKPGATLVVARVGNEKPQSAVTSVVVDKVAQAVKGYDQEGKLVVFYPATIGSSEFPSPTGNLKVTAIAENPTFTLTSKVKYARLKKGQVITVPAGPNNPVGATWIGLSKSGYGIHGSPHPELIRQRESHGCVRLTNWDARELAQLVHPGVPVRFAGK
jgi:lipoprotein-anchoring transpeptidase ErfK/SrfK